MRLIALAAVLLSASACAPRGIRPLSPGQDATKPGWVISQSLNTWNDTLFYCVPNADDGRAKPKCYEARFRSWVPVGDEAKE